MGLALVGPAPALVSCAFLVALGLGEDVVLFKVCITLATLTAVVVAATGLEDAVDAAVVDDGEGFAVV